MTEFKPDRVNRLAEQMVDEDWRLQEAIERIADRIGMTRSELWGVMFDDD